MNIIFDQNVKNKMDLLNCSCHCEISTARGGEFPTVDVVYFSQ